MHLFRTACAHFLWKTIKNVITAESDRPIKSFSSGCVYARMQTLLIIRDKYIIIVILYERFLTPLIIIVCHQSHKTWPIRLRFTIFCSPLCAQHSKTRGRITSILLPCYLPPSNRYETAFDCRYF